MTSKISKCNPTIRTSSLLLFGCHGHHVRRHYKYCKAVTYAFQSSLLFHLTPNQRLIQSHCLIFVDNSHTCEGWEHETLRKPAPFLSASLLHHWKQVNKVWIVSISLAYFIIWPPQNWQPRTLHLRYFQFHTNDIEWQLYSVFVLVKYLIIAFSSKSKLKENQRQLEINYFLQCWHYINFWC
jgi:hypothetical protein